MLNFSASSHDSPAGPAGEGAPDRRALALPPINSDSLLRGATEVRIEHRGSIYRLRLTSLGKLILTK